jgi:hypothetical protein
MYLVSNVYFRFEIALPHSETELLIPSKLPKAKPVIHPPGLCELPYYFCYIKGKSYKKNQNKQYFFIIN